MIDPASALMAASAPVVKPPTLAPRVLVLGGGGPLGSAVLEALLATHRFAGVGVAAVRRVAPALRALAVVDGSEAEWQALEPDSALIVFDRTRHANGRDEAFLRPQPQDLLALATVLRRIGVRRLVVVVPHKTALLPLALRQGLATLDETAVAALGFEQLVFMRLARDDAGGAEQAWLPRLASALLRQLHWMVVTAEQPVRDATVARLLGALLLALPKATGATRVLPAVLPWLVAQGEDADAVVDRWLATGQVPELRAAPRRW
ncbi:MAG: hypothetical protein JNM08_17915 [Rubrivivax sp.]|nr:hypothetical protein [Rubrivivax sp.]